MNEEANSWLRRTKFSHTVYHRWDSLRLNPVPFVIEPNRNPGLKSRPQSTSSALKSNPDVSKIQRSFISNKQRSLSPLPESNLSEAFKEAKSSSKRFSTPTPQLRPKEFLNKLLNKEHQDSKSANLKPLMNTSPLKHLAMAKGGDKSKFRKDLSWTKYFESGGGRVTAVESADDWNVDLSKLFLGLRFAHGAHSRLYHGKYKDEPVAVKIIRVPEDDENGVLGARLEKQFTREVTLLSRLYHPNVIKFVAACRNPPVYCVITEYLSQGSLRSYLHKLEHSHGSLPLQKLIAIALDIARGMEFIHSQGIIHRDLKPENVLIDENFHLKIADFGIACPEAFFDPLADDPGTYRWMAPEMIKHKPYGRKVDVYSFGLMLWEMVAGVIPYEDMTPIQAAFAVVNKNLRPVISSDCPLAMRALIEQCWSVNPEKRPDFWQVVKVLEQFESSLVRDGTLNLLGNPLSSFHDHKKGLLHWIQKLGPLHPEGSPVPKPKFS